jgi:hypothetical protein
MIEIKKIYEEESFNILGYYSEDHIDKEVFLENVIEYIKETTDEDSLEFINLPTLEQVEYVWYKEEEINDEYNNFIFIFSNKAKEGYSRMTRYYL